MHVYYHYVSVRMCMYICDIMKKSHESGIYHKRLHSSRISYVRTYIRTCICVGKVHYLQ